MERHGGWIRRQEEGDGGEVDVSRVVGVMERGKMSTIRCGWFWCVRDSGTLFLLLFFFWAHLMTDASRIAVMLADGQARNDFRDGFDEESRRVIAQNPGKAPEEIGESLCYLVDPKGEALMPVVFGAVEGQMRASMVMMVFGCATIFAKAVKDLGWGGSWAMPTLVVCGVVAVVALVVLVFSGKDHELTGPKIQALLPKRPYAPFGLTGDVEGIAFYAAGVSENKPGLTKYPGDAVMVVIDSRRRRVILEGLRYRYVIHAKDFVCVEPFEMHANSVQGKALLKYKVGMQTVALELWLVDLVKDVSMLRMGLEAMPRTEGFCVAVYEAVG
jgi:hypothetical protein